jgi:hypothetical protein
VQDLPEPKSRIYCSSPVPQLGSEFWKSIGRLRQRIKCWFCEVVATVLRHSIAAGQSQPDFESRILLHNTSSRWINRLLLDLRLNSIALADPHKDIAKSIEIQLVAGFTMPVDHYNRTLAGYDLIYQEDENPAKRLPRIRYLTNNKTRHVDYDRVHN